ncbi:SAM-dependent MidA family methyltransferase [Roseimicrobium gellanilyticum]|uniref:SAM-dependent MidA family methyltransferase n=1 Tax=Roseimicrobium gellanilyticum TaxID=748857 RepID=A0A366H7J1_9BACT|nr:SAM-dependent methyltransferase [Roseimicrobium gellanilyticum]RBP37411.1 SAM-dependent MidA family methyltransferase [Roseimicrobium gellanilyticum]
MANANPVPSAQVLIRNRIAAAAAGRLPWAEVMQIALYEPGMGYYRQGVRKIGREGDFYTSVSAGPLFGQLLAEQARQVWAAMGRPDEFTLIEQGAHDGTLARDVLVGCQELDPDFAGIVRYVLIEPDTGLREAQQSTLAQHARVTWVSELAGLPSSPAALFLCNELLDAFPVHRVRWDGSAWRELWVALDPPGDAPSSAKPPLQFVEAELSHAALEARTAALGTAFPTGYTTEICLAVDAWVESLAAAPFAGAVLVLDYGMPDTEYYAPGRTDGTLRRYFHHRMDDKVLDDLCEADLTADVNFTCVVKTAEKTGLELASFIEQGRYLTKLFADTLSSRPMSMDAATKRQFHTLTHPGILGRNFHALLLAKGVPAARFLPPNEQEAGRRRLGL